MSSWADEAAAVIDRMPQKVLDLREACKASLWKFAKMMNPRYMYGSVHQEIYEWVQDYSVYKDTGDDSGSNKLIMLPRGHLKSHMVATWCAWIITKHPEITILYASATEALSILQLDAIKNILSSDAYTTLFPEYLHPSANKREKWSQTQMSVDHPSRDEESTRDPTVRVTGLTTTSTGWHCEVIVFDDLVVPENAYTLEGRTKVSNKSSQFSSILNNTGFTLACGTTYDPRDVYAEWDKITFEVYDEEGNVVENRKLWDIKKFVVEENGLFCWPRAVRPDGKAFGFDLRSLAKIRAKYTDKRQFYAQYYNDPNDPGSERINASKFQYYNLKYLTKEGGRWFYQGRKLNIYASIDFAFSLSKSADWTAIVVVGVCHEGHYYVLDIDRFKTDKIKDYYDHTKVLHSRWSFQKVRAEVNVAQKVICNALKAYIKKEGLFLSVEEFRPGKGEGTKAERIASSLEPLYEELVVWHLEGGLTPVLEDELEKARPEHDDIKDAMASAVEIAIVPKKPFGSGRFQKPTTKNQSRFGGVAFRG